MKLRIEKAVYGGDGLARIPVEDAANGGKTVFVPGSLPGEYVEAHITEDRRSFAQSELEAVLEPSPERVTPACEYVPRCGGCQYQHARYDAQLQMKLSILKETLSRAHISFPAEIGSLQGPALEYRNRIRLHSMPGSALGYRERGSHTLLAVDHCPIAAPVLQEAIRAVARVGSAAGVARLYQEIEFFTNHEQDQLLVSLWPVAGKTQPRKREEALESFAELLKKELPLLSGVGLFAENEIMHWGERSLTYTVSSQAYQVSLGSFFQVNRFLIPGLLALVLNDSAGDKREGRLAWDLYAGAGLFAQALPYENVTAVESAGFSADDGKHNLARRGQRLVRSSTLEFLRNQTRAGVRSTPDLIVVDPPRAGLGKEVCSLLGKIAAPTIVCISCDPATLARDLQSLLPFGYVIEAMHLVDLFPQTFHLETIAILKRN